MRTLFITIITMALLAGSTVGAMGQTDETSLSAEGVVAEELFTVTLGEDAIPEELAGILFFRKRYPTDQEMTYGSSFVPPNTFVRYVEAGELGLRPNSDIHIIRDAMDGAGAEVVAAGTEAVVSAGDTFVMTDLPYDEFGHEALGEMWTPGDEDAEVVGFAIREMGRCCAMSHLGMVSPWYVTLSGPAVSELQGQPVTLALTRWELEPGAAAPPSAETDPAIRRVEEGAVTVAEVAASRPDEDLSSFEYTAGSSVYPTALDEGEMVVFRNDGDGPAVMYELVVTAAAEES